MFFRKDGSASDEWAPFLDGVIRSDRDTFVRNVTLEAQNSYTTEEMNSYSSSQPFTIRSARRVTSFPSFRWADIQTLAS